MIAILDFGSQYGQLIARRVREHNVYSRIFPADVKADELSRLEVKGVILSGGPAIKTLRDVMRKSLSLVCRFWESAMECN